MSERGGAPRRAGKDRPPAAPSRPRRVLAAWRTFGRVIKFLNYATGLIAGLFIVSSAVIITNEVIWRYYLRRPHTWNLEVNVFLLIGATFLAANYTQMKRGHVGTEVLETLMPARWNHWRIFAGDVLSFLLCAFAAVMVLQYDWQAWSGDWTTDSTWAPPLWIPYTVIGVGLVLISLEYIVQLVEQFVGGVAGKADGPG